MDECYYDRNELISKLTDVEFELGQLAVIIFQMRRKLGSFETEQSEEYMRRRELIKERDQLNDTLNGYHIKNKF